jgi:hypothetical protein
MPPYRCSATFYVIASCTENTETHVWTCTLDVCDLHDPNTCDCTDLTGGGDDDM